MLPATVGAIGAGIGGLASYFGASSLKKGQAQAQQRWMDFLMSSPAWKAQQQTLAYLSPQLGKGSPMLALQYGRGREDITRAGERSVRRSRTYWGREGNVGRARGEEQRARLGTSEALGGLALGYGGAQEQHKLNIAQMLAGVGQGMAGLTTAAGQGILGQGQAGYQGWADFMDILGSYMGWNRPLAAGGVPPGAAGSS